MRSAANCESVLKKSGKPFAVSIIERNQARAARYTAPGREQSGRSVDESGNGVAVAVWVSPAQMIEARGAQAIIRSRPDRQCRPVNPSAPVNQLRRLINYTG
jgi:hypothetical protein